MGDKSESRAGSSDFERSDQEKKKKHAFYVSRYPVPLSLRTPHASGTLEKLGSISQNGTLGVPDI